MKSALNYLLFFILLSCSQTSFSQKKVDITVILPSNIDFKKMHIAYDDGLNQKSVKPMITNHKFSISDSCHSRYATLTIDYPDSTETDGIPCFSFWVTCKPANISFYRDNARHNNPFQNFHLENAFALADMGGTEFSTFTETESHDAQKFYKENSDSIRNYPVWKNILHQKLQKLDRKEMLYIRLHPDDYYSLWQFDREIVGSGNIKADSLLRFFEEIFPDSLKYTLEGKEVVTKLKGRINTIKGGEAPDFNVKDTRGKVCSLNLLKSKYILIDFWASWCAPCIREMPNIKAISNLYPKDKLEIISVSLDHNFTNFKAAIDKNGMNWTQIYNGWVMINSYAVGSVPQIFLIDRNGMVVYSRAEEDDLVGLKHLKEILSLNLGSR